MASNFTSLRSSRANLLTSLAAAVKQETAKGGGADDRFWKLSVDQKSKNGYARLRFLPAPKGEEIPWARVFSHAFQGPGGSWLIDRVAPGGQFQYTTRAYQEEPHGDGIPGVNLTVISPPARVSEGSIPGSPPKWYPCGVKVI